MFKKAIILFLLSFVVFFLVLLLINSSFLKRKKGAQWEFQSIDTMKYSRDLARETFKNQSFNYTIDQQVSDIAKTGATHIAIDTPYDEEFLPVLRLWVQAARRNHIKVFFRGNFSGWEKWFGYEKIDSLTHLQKTKKFIEENSNLFEDGDVFTSCPECENGIEYDIGSNENFEKYRNFLIEEYITTKNSFKSINKKVTSNYYSMNGDIAYRLMDKETTKAFDGVVVIDHYVKSPQKLEEDLRNLANRSGGQIILGEFGAPIPNIHGKMTDAQQSEWIDEALSRLSKIPELKGVNYWVNAGGSTSLWYDSGVPKPALDPVTQFFTGLRK